MNVEFHPAALQEVENAQAWYEERSLLSASAFLRELSIAVQRIGKRRTAMLQREVVLAGFFSIDFRSRSTTEFKRTR